MSLVQADSKSDLGVSGEKQKAAGALPETRPSRKKSRTFLRKAALGSALPILVLAIWQYISGRELVDPMLFPAPTTIARTFYEMILSGELIENLEVSVLRAVLGFLLGGGTGLLLGLTVGMFNRAEELLDPTVQMIRTIPLLAITPLFILWFGFGETSKVLMIAVGAFFPLYVNTFLGVRNVDSKLFDVARVLEFGRFKQMTRLVLPAAMPNVLLGLRLSISVA